MTTVEHPPTAWRDAARAAEIAARLSEAATAAVDQAGPSDIALQELVSVVEAAAAASERAAETARICATRARERSEALRAELREAQQVAADTAAEERQARDQYREAAVDAFARARNQSPAQ